MKLRNFQTCVADMCDLLPLRRPLGAGRAKHYMFGAQNHTIWGNPEYTHFKPQNYTLFEIREMTNFRFGGIPGISYIATCWARNV